MLEAKHGNGIINILLIEDNHAYADILGRHLAGIKQVKITIESRGSLSQGLARLAEAGIDLIFLDLSMPESCGIDTVLRVHTSFPLVPIVVLIAYDDDELAAEAIKSGAQDYLTKGNLDSELLWRSINYAMERQQSSQALRWLAALQDAEQRLNLALVSARMAVWDWDIVNDTVWRSLKHDEIFGYESMLPKWTYEEFLKHVIDEDRTVVQQKVDLAFVTGCFSVKFRITHAFDHSVRWLAAQGETYKNEEGKVVRMIGTVMDITEGWQLEQLAQEA